MLGPLRRTSFTARMIALVTAVMFVLLVVDYVALLRLPRQVAQDSVEVVLRQHVQTLNLGLREQRFELQQSVDEFVARPEVRRAIINRDEATLRALVDAADELGPQVLFAYRRASEATRDGTGIITAPIVVQDADSSTPIVFRRRLDDAALDVAASSVVDDAAYALELDDTYVARSESYPDTAVDDGDDDADADGEPTGTPAQSKAGLTSVNVDGERLHVYSQQVPDTEYHIHALSTPQLEEETLSQVRTYVRASLGGMTAATLVAFMLIMLFMSKTVRGFADRVGRLADGDYGTRMAVNGNDSFAALASNVNELSAQLADQLGQLEQTAEAFRSTLETLEEGICVWNDDGDIVYWNRGAEQLTGLARERAAPSDPIVAFLHAERAPGTRRVTLPVRRAGAGLVVDLVVTAMPGGGVLQTFRDTTLVDMLQQTQRNFLATAAHELRTPITTILGFADTLTNDELQLTARQRMEFLEIIRTQSYRLQDLIEAFFTSYQLANERVEISLGATDPLDAVTEALERVATANPQRVDDVGAITVEIAPDCRVLADHRALVGVVAVLVDNAVKYGAGPITVSSERHGGNVALLVRDSGPGIDPYHHSRIFDPFYRIDVDMRSGVGGAGLGLFTARKLVEAMHGVIHVRSSVDAGATFIVELPVAADEVAAPGDFARVAV